MNENLKIHEITLDWLRREGACNADDCAALFADSDSLPITPALIMQAHEVGLLNADWVAERILTAPALAEYERVTDLESVEYERVTDLESVEFERVTAPAWAKYKRVKASTLAELCK